MTKGERRDQKRQNKRKMRVVGKSVFTLKKLFNSPKEGGR